jgi:hypothetical protein
MQEMSMARTVTMEIAELIAGHPYKGFKMFVEK